MEPINPHLFLTVELDRYGVKGYLAIDRLVCGSSWGGLRLISDPYSAELIASARTMTLKYGFIGLRTGGAKGALEFPERLHSERRDLLMEFGKVLSPVLRSGEWQPAIDMGSNVRDIEDVYLGAGIPKDFSSWRNLSHLYTAWSVFCSARAALKSVGEGIRGKTVAVQGLGKVGAEVATLLVGAGARLVGISNRMGALFHSRCLDIEKIRRLKKDLGDSFLEAFRNGESIERDSLLEFDVDILVPCARCWAIHEENVDRIRARIIPCAANAAMSPEVERELLHRGKVVITDFVANCGGVLGGTLERFVSPSVIRRYLETRYFSAIEELLQESQRSGRTICDIATEQALERLSSFESKPPIYLSELFKSVLAAAPRFLREPLVYRYSTRRFFSSGKGRARPTGATGGPDW